jgi:hypothetical protein
MALEHRNRADLPPYVQPTYEACIHTNQFYQISAHCCKMELSVEPSLIILLFLIQLKNTKPRASNWRTIKKQEAAASPGGDVDQGAWTPHSKPDIPIKTGVTGIELSRKRLVFMLEDGRLIERFLSGVQVRRPSACGQVYVLQICSLKGAVGTRTRRLSPPWC